MAKKRILMLGGAYSQIPAIVYAKKSGYEVITCDYLPENPGHAYGDKYCNVSTTDMTSVLGVAVELKIDGIVAYASDPAAPTAAFVSGALSLPGASCDAVRILSEKDRFREFLTLNDFSCPAFMKVSGNEPIDDSRLKNLNLPLYVKPVDSSGSKGMSKVYCYQDIGIAVKQALDASRCKRVIIEEHVETPYCQLHGDGFVEDGRLKFLGLCDHYFHDLAPIGSIYPTRQNPSVVQAVSDEIQRLIDLVGFENGAINVEVRINSEDRLFLMEIGPRSGGNYVPQLMELGTGFDEVAAIVDQSMGKKPRIDFTDRHRHCMQLIVGSKSPGHFKGLHLDAKVENKVEKMYLHKKPGDPIGRYSDSAFVVAVLLVRGHNYSELQEIMLNVNDYVKVEM
ncbi:MAG: ATP-grasp domain-containing protein [Eubacteriales bacterium]|nr:ATP-grasp domain-containing protein [Eubacteriales bacterium]